MNLKEFPEAQKVANSYCIMTAFNSHFIQRYGSTIFVDATYNIDCENSILFVVAVLTNCGYEPVMMSIVPNETSDVIQTALQHVKDRTGLSPKFMMMDDSAAYQKAAKTVFPGKEYPITPHST